MRLTGKQKQKVVFIYGVRTCLHAGAGVVRQPWLGFPQQEYCHRQVTAESQSTAEEL